MLYEILTLFKHQDKCLFLTLNSMLEVAVVKFALGVT